MKYLVIPSVFIFFSFIQSCTVKQERTQEVQGKIDSLIVYNNELKQKISQLQKADTLSEVSVPEIKIDTLVGSFTKAFLADCFHLTFKDKNGKLWNFDNPDNIYGVDLLDTQNELKLKKGVSSKTFKIWYANLKGIDCVSADSYYKSGKRNYKDMPTIIKVVEMK